MAGVKEHLADASTEAAQQAGLYMEAKLLYRQAHMTCRDAESQLGWMRVSAKAHPDMDWVPNPSMAGRMHDGGAARALRDGVTLDQLP